MVRLCSLAIVVCELLPGLQSTRIHRGIAHEVQSSGHPEDADMTAVAYDEKLLACEQVETQERIIIQAKDKPFVEYDYAVDDGLYEESSRPIICKTFTPPPKPSSTLRNLTTHTLPEDVIGLVAASFNHDVHCESCRLFSFNMTFLERCGKALAQNQWARVSEEVLDEGGSCETSMTWEEQTLQTCMTSPKANQVAVCRVQSAADDLVFINLKERIKENEDAIKARPRAIKKTIRKHNLFIKKKQKNIKDLQDFYDMHKQNSVYLKQIFEGP